MVVLKIKNPKSGICGKGGVLSFVLPDVERREVLISVATIEELDNFLEKKVISKEIYDNAFKKEGRKSVLIWNNPPKKIVEDFTLWSGK